MQRYLERTVGFSMHFYYRRTCTRENSYGSALHIAACKDKEEITSVLLLFGANMDISNTMGYTPLQLNIKR